jgi:hypothetical protein
MCFNIRGKILYSKLLSGVHVANYLIVLRDYLLLDNILQWWMNLLENILMTCEKYILEYPFLFTLVLMK